MMEDIDMKRVAFAMLIKSKFTDYGNRLRSNVPKYKDVDDIITMTHIQLIAFIVVSIREPNEWDEVIVGDKIDYHDGTPLPFAECAHEMNGWTDEVIAGIFKGFKFTVNNVRTKLVAIN